MTISFVSKVKVVCDEDFQKETRVIEEEAT